VQYHSNLRYAISQRTSSDVNPRRLVQMSSQIIINSRDAHFRNKLSLERSSLLLSSRKLVDNCNGGNDINHDCQDDHDTDKRVLFSPTRLMVPRGILASTLLSCTKLALAILALSHVFYDGKYKNVTPLDEAHHLENENSHRRLLLESNTSTSIASPANATFEGYTLTFQDTSPQQTISHCVGENYQSKTSWMHRSCHFQFMCFDTASQEYVVFNDPQVEGLMQEHVEDSHHLLDVSQSYLQPSINKHNTVSIGGINLKWGMDDNFGINRLEWFPQIRTVQDYTAYWELPDNVVMIPFHSLNGANPGHLVWDDFLPIWTLLTIFQLDQSNMELLMMRYILQDGIRGLWASCDYKDENNEQCTKMQRKFLPLMVGLGSKYTDMPTNEDFAFRVPQDPKLTSTRLVCAKHGLAGIGSLTDHGVEKLHGWEARDYETTQNHGRGGMLYEFRNFMMENLHIPTRYTHEPPFRIVFSESSSSIGHRNFDFSKQKHLLQESFHSSYVTVESYVFSELSLTEQVEIAGQTSIFITSCGGGAVTSMFLPRGSSVVMFYLEYGGIVHGKESNQPARLDWDLFNNMSHLKVHWLPGGTMKGDRDLRAFVLLVQHELDGLIRERSYDHFFN
jgi:hypothetical protein